MACFFFKFCIPLQGYPGMQGGVGAPGPVGAAVKIMSYFQFSPSFVCLFVRSFVRLFVSLFVCVFNK